MDVKIKVDNNKRKRKESLPAQAQKRQFIAPEGPFRPENDKSSKNKIDGIETSNFMGVSLSSFLSWT